MSRLSSATTSLGLQGDASRKIIHCDCDCFYASVEMRDDPSIVGRPVAVGGSSDRRGVIATCNYEARRYGVHSAMPTATAHRLCPDLLVIPTNMEKYREVAGQIHRIFADFTDLVEPLSLDEAYLDVSGVEHCRGSASLMAEEIRRRVRSELGITISAGVAPNKFLAKVASDWNKPDGLTVIAPDQVAEFVRQLPVKRIPGVGKVTAENLSRLGIENCEQLQAWKVEDLVQHFGKFGRRLYDCARGQDGRPVKVARQRKSVSVERTFADDIADPKKAAVALTELVTRLQQRVGDSRSAPVKGIFVKLKSCDFQLTTVDHRLEQATWAQDQFLPLLEQAWERLQRPVRLIGAGVRFADRTPVTKQLSLFAS
ncbi:DNA polymerase IV [Spongiibacter nanhainus]|uniref:DNA polymerase IV n=1 Tax=Spongiibacter nanhainus TaxID=2794344 RepID=A0A7T4R3A3_9GAMM|nr:DNA polymerase IV [Spongiibacter nanhainus]